MKVLSDWDAKKIIRTLEYEKFEKFVRGSGSKSHFSSGALPSLVVIGNANDHVTDNANDKRPMFLNANGLQVRKAGNV